MSGSFTPASLITLARWSRHLGFALLFLFIVHGGSTIAAAWTIHHSRVVVTLIYGVLFLIPGIVLMIIPRHVEDGRTWAFYFTFVVAFISIFAIFMDAFATCLFTLAIMLIPIRTVAAAFNAYPDLRDMKRNRERRNPPQGFQPIMNAPSAVPAVPISGNPSPEGAAGGANDHPEAPLLPRFVPDSLFKATRNTRSVGGVMLVAFLVTSAMGIATFADGYHGALDWTRMLGVRVIALLVPGVASLLLGGKIEMGRRWAVVAIGSLCIVAMGTVWIAFAFSLSPAATNIGVGMNLAILCSALCGLVLVFCLYVWRDIRDVARSLARDRLAAKRVLRRARPVSESRPNRGTSG